MATTSAVLTIGGDFTPMYKGLSIAVQNMQRTMANTKFVNPLGSITRDTRDFDKSLQAASQRVIAFSASLGTLTASVALMKNIVTNARDIEKTFIDINSVFQLSSQGLQKFARDTFDVARQTSQSFEAAAEAAREFSRQGLNAEETLKRMRDALILTRASGLDVTKSVETLTAAVNGFASASVDTTKVINKLVAVDQSFAVSAKDLAEALSRVGSTAQDTGVSFDELIGLVTAAQQTTARGGAVIGNSLKTIFTRVQRADTLDQLEALGVAVKDVRGNVLPTITILDSLAKSFDTMSDAAKNQTAELVGGVFQVNVLRSVLRDLGKEQGIFKQATEASAGAVDEAIRRNEALNKSLDSLLVKTQLTAKQITAAMGQIAVSDKVKGVLNVLNDNVITDSLKNINVGDTGLNYGEDIGANVAEGIMSGIGNILTGPAVIYLVSILGKVATKTLQTFMGDATQMLGMNKESQRQAELAQKIASLYAVGDDKLKMQLMTAKSLTEQVTAYESALARVNNYQNANNSSFSVISSQLLGRRRSGGSFAGGFLDDSIKSEVSSIKSGVGGVSPNEKPVVIESLKNGPGKGQPIVANTGEFLVKTASGTGIFNPNMMARFGLSGRVPRAANGFLPSQFKSLISNPGFKMTAQDLSGVQLPSSGYGYSREKVEAEIKKMLMSVLEVSAKDLKTTKSPVTIAFKELLKDFIDVRSNEIQQVVQKNRNFLKELYIEKFSPYNNTPRNPSSELPFHGVNLLNNVYSSHGDIFKPVRKPGLIETGVRKNLLDLSFESASSVLGKNVDRVTRPFDVTFSRLFQNQFKNAPVNREFIDTAYNLNNASTLQQDFTKNAQNLIRRGASVPDAIESAARTFKEAGGTEPKLRKAIFSTISSLENYAKQLDETTKTQKEATIRRDRIERATLDRQVSLNRIGEKIGKTGVDSLNDKEKRLYERTLLKKATNELGFGSTSMVALKSNTDAMESINKKVAQYVNDMKIEANRLQEKIARRDRIDRATTSRVATLNTINQRIKTGDFSFYENPMDEESVRQKRLLDRVLYKRAADELGFGKVSATSLKRDTQASRQIEEKMSEYLKNMREVSEQDKPNAFTQFNDRMNPVGRGAAFRGFFAGFGAEKTAEELIRKNGLSGLDADALRSQAANVRSMRIQQAAFGASFALPMAAGFIPNGTSGEASGKLSGAASSALNLAGSGMALGSIFGPTGIMAGAIIGGITGAVTGFASRVNKSFEELAKEIEDSNAKNVELINQASEIGRISESLKTTALSGGKKEDIEKLIQLQNDVFSSITDPKIRQQILDAQGDLEKIDKIRGDLVRRSTAQSRASDVISSLTKADESRGLLGASFRFGDISGKEFASGSKNIQSLIQNRLSTPGNTLTLKDIGQSFKKDPIAALIDLGVEAEMVTDNMREMSAEIKDMASSALGRIKLPDSRLSAQIIKQADFSSEMLKLTSQIKSSAGEVQRESSSKAEISKTVSDILNNIRSETQLDSQMNSTRNQLGYINAIGRAQFTGSMEVGRASILESIAQNKGANDVALMQAAKQASSISDFSDLLKMNPNPKVSQEIKDMVAQLKEIQQNTRLEAEKTAIIADAQRIQIKIQERANLLQNAAYDESNIQKFFDLRIAGRSGLGANPNASRANAYLEQDKMLTSMGITDIPGTRAVREKLQLMTALPGIAEVTGMITGQRVSPTTEAIKDAALKKRIDIGLPQTVDAEMEAKMLERIINAVKRIDDPEADIKRISQKFGANAISAELVGMSKESSVMISGIDNVVSGVNKTNDILSGIYDKITENVKDSALSSANSIMGNNLATLQSELANINSKQTLSPADFIKRARNKAANDKIFDERMVNSVEIYAKRNGIISSGEDKAKKQLSDYFENYVSKGKDISSLEKSVMNPEGDIYNELRRNEAFKQTLVKKYGDFDTGLQSFLRELLDFIATNVSSDYTAFKKELSQRKQRLKQDITNQQFGIDNLNAGAQSATINNFFDKRGIGFKYADMAFKPNMLVTGRPSSYGKEKFQNTDVAGLSPSVGAVALKESELIFKRNKLGQQLTDINKENASLEKQLEIESQILEVDKELAQLRGARAAEIRNIDFSMKLNTLNRRSAAGQPVSGSEYESVFGEEARARGLTGDSLGSFKLGAASQFKRMQQDLFDLSDVGARVAQSLEQNLGNAFGDFAVGAAKGKDAFRSFVVSVTQDASRAFASKAMQQLLGMMLGQGSSGAGFFGLFSPKAVGGPASKSPALLTKDEVVIPKDSANTIGYDTLYKINSGTLPTFARGGLVKGGSGTKDDVFAMLTPGDFVIKKSSVQKYGSENLLEMIKNKRVQKKFLGGTILGGTILGALLGGGLGYATNGKKGALIGAIGGGILGGLAQSSMQSAAASSMKSSVPSLSIGTSQPMAFNQVAASQPGFLNGNTSLFNNAMPSTPITGLLNGNPYMVNGTATLASSSFGSVASASAAQVAQQSLMGSLIKSAVVAGGLGLISSLSAKKPEKEAAPYLGISSAEIDAYQKDVSRQQTAINSSLKPGEFLTPVVTEDGFTVLKPARIPATRRFANGGPVPASLGSSPVPQLSIPGSSKLVPSKLMAGEIVVEKDDVQAIGVQHFANGGFVGSPMLSSPTYAPNQTESSSKPSLRDINISVTIHKDGSVEKENRGGASDNEQGNQLAKELEGKVIEVVTKMQLPGGQLYNSYGQSSMSR